MATIPTPEITALLTRYKAGETLSKAETVSLAEWLHDADDLAFEGAADGILPLETMSLVAEKSLEAKLDLLEAPNEDTPVYPIHRITFMRRIRWVAAAVILFAFAGGAWWWFSNDAKQSSPLSVSVYKNDVAPGKKGGILKLSDNRRFGIDTLKEGFIAFDAGMEVYKENGRIVYKGTATETAYNEIIEETGRFTMAELPDHSIAWVASNSSIRYPLRFAADERRVTMKGQAAFQVVHSEKQPFRVQAGTQVFEDMGTVFNIRAYSDEPEIKATVKEGLVRTGTTMIRPLQQARIDKDGKVTVMDNVNIESVFAWRDGEFAYSGASIEEIMNEAARWYGVQIVYKDQINQRFSFIGIDRNMPISNLLKNLEIAGGVHFEVEGKKVTVKK